MARSKSKSTPIPTEAELEILRVLWELGPSTVRQVHDAMRTGRETGYTTTLKIMQIMTEKKLVQRDESQRSHVYAASVSRDSTQRRLVSGLLQRVFSGSASQLVMQALAAKRPSDRELQQVRDLVDKYLREP